VDEKIDVLDSTDVELPAVKAPTQVSAASPAPKLDLPNQAPTPVNAVSIEQASTGPVQDPNATPVPKEIPEEAKVNIAIPTGTGEVVASNDADGDGIPESSNKEAELIKNEDLSKVNNVKKGKIKFNISILKKSVPMSFTILIGVLSMIVGGYIGKTLFPTVIFNNRPSAQRANQNASARVADGKNNTTQAGNYTYKIPEKYVYDKSSHGVLIYDTSDTFRIYIRGQEGIYNDIANAKTSVKATMEEKGLYIKSIKEVSIKEHPYIIAETIDNLNNRLIAFTKASDKDVFYVEIVTSENSYDYSVLELADDILTNATYNEETSAMEKIEVNDIATLIINAAEVYKSLTN